MRPQGLTRAFSNGELSNPCIINVTKDKNRKPSYAIAYQHINSKFLVFQYYKVAAKLHEFISLDAAYKELRKIGFDQAKIFDDINLVDSQIA